MRVLESLMAKEKIPHRANERFSEQETARRRDAVIKRMLNTPPKPHSEMKVGKPRGKTGKSPSKGKRKS